MPSRLRTIFTVIFVAAALFITVASSGETSKVESGDIDAPKALKMQMRSRSRSRVLTDVLDYDYGAANSKHDPHRKPGNGH